MPCEARGDQPGKVLPTTLFSRQQVMCAKIVQKTGPNQHQNRQSGADLLEMVQKSPSTCTISAPTVLKRSNNRKLAKTKATYL